MQRISKCSRERFRSFSESVLFVICQRILTFHLISGFPWRHVIPNGTDDRNTHTHTNTHTFTGNLVHKNTFFSYSSVSLFNTTTIPIITCIFLSSHFSQSLISQGEWKKWKSIYKSRISTQAFHFTHFHNHFFFSQLKPTSTTPNLYSLQSIPSTYIICVHVFLIFKCK